MYSTAIIIFREIFEIALLLSVIMAATHEIKGRWKIVFLGLGLGSFGAALVALFAGEISNMAEGMGQELFNALILFAATAMIGWTVIWMSRHARELSHHITKLGQDILAGEAGFYSMAIVIALAVLREGSEIVLFVYSMLAAGQPAAEIIAGSFVGIAGGSIAGLLLYLGLIKISPKHVFLVTTWLLIFVASGMASIGASFLTAAGYFSNLTHTVWDTSSIIAENGIIGRTLHILIGYSQQPMQIQIIFYLTTFTILSLGAFTMKPKKAAKKAS
jgi:high-affinity iron transporter